MKRLITFLLIILLSVLFISCNKQDNQNVELDNNLIGLANPIKEYDSLDTINEIVGCNLILPTYLEANNIIYTTINDDVAQITFDYLDYSWTLRGSKKIHEDISGIYDENNEFEANQDTTIYLNDYYIERMFVEDQQYSIILSNPNNFDEEVFSNTVFDIMKAIKIKSDPNHISGYYLCSNIENVTMTIDKYESNYEIYVYWPTDNGDYTEWYMSGTYDGNKITYAGENFATHSFDENHKELIGDGASNNIGYFEIKNNNLYWLGAAQEQCRLCIFEKNN